MRLAPLLAVTLSMALIGSLRAEDDARSYFSLKEDMASTGSNIKRKTVSGSALPLDKRYDELTAEQQGFVRSQYEEMNANDEPPFPIAGLRPIYRQVAAGQQKFLVTGHMSLSVEINSQGEAVSVSVQHSPSPEMTRYVASVLMFEKYKPALCNGTPCTMQFPFRMNFERSLN